MPRKPKLRKCDCLNVCGDDPDVFNGKAEKCEHRKALDARPKVTTTERGADARTIIMTFDKDLSDDEFKRMAREATDHHFHIQR